MLVGVHVGVFEGVKVALFLNCSFSLLPGPLLTDSHLLFSSSCALRRLGQVMELEFTVLLPQSHCWGSAVRGQAFCPLHVLDCRWSEHF